MSRRVFEVARELGLKGKDLAEKINAMGLSFAVNNHLSSVTLEQEDELKRALEREAREEMVQERISATVIRRKPKRKEAAAPMAGPGEPAGIPMATTAAAEPPIESIVTVFTPAPITSAPEAAPAKAEGEVAVRKRRAAARKTPPAQVAAAPTATTGHPAEAGPPVGPPLEAGAQQAVSETTPPLQPKLPAPPAEATATAEASTLSGELVALPTSTTKAAAEQQLEELEPEEPEEEGEEIEEEIEGEEEAAQPSVPVYRPAPDEIMAALAKKAIKKTKKGQKAAQVVGTLSPELLQQRLAVDNKIFGPAPPAAEVKPPSGTRETFEEEEDSRRKRKRGKKVYGAAELYDQRSSRRRAQKKAVGGQATKITTAAEHKRVIRMEEAILVSELARQMGVKAGEIALKLMMDLGIKGANINTPLDFETATLLAEGYSYSVEQVGFDLQKYLPHAEESEEDYLGRPPVITVMGHVDHGKTTLLDAIRASNVAQQEAGGITQHIGAYKVRIGNGTLIFLDTPGHEAFTALRARGAQATDIVVLVVAADDGVMPQTVEAINHAKDAGVPIIVAVNKMDREGANPDRVIKSLAEHGLIPESWGGDTLFQLVSAKEKAGIEELLSSILLQAELLELKANPDRPGEGIVIESRLDIGRGPVASVLVQQGTVSPGDVVVAGGHWGRIRALTDEIGKKLKKATPSTPVEITGLDGVPDAGETMYVVEDEKAAKAIADHISEQKRQKELARTTTAPRDLEQLTELLEAGELKEVKLIIKADVQGSVEALEQAVSKLSTPEVKVHVVHSAVGGITESDVNLAASTGGRAIIIGFNIRPESRAMQQAEQLGVTIQTFSIIYDVIDSVKKLMTGMLEPVFEEHYLGRAEVRDVFSIPKVGTVAGCHVVEGRMVRGSLARIVRNSRIIYQSSISSLRRFKEDVKEVRHGFECGLSITNFNDIKAGDVIESYEMAQTTPTL
ncbi:MAG: translation initiation factor IF-2 [Bradymonadales bacterium]|nr:translation initiation factor IF-2 [Bradymonadales bacterium]